MEITQQNRGFRTCYDQNNEHQEQKSEHVISLMGPKKVKILKLWTNFLKFIDKKNITKCYSR